jgi:hypothetical protein
MKHKGTDTLLNKPRYDQSNYLCCHIKLAATRIYLTEARDLIDLQLQAGDLWCNQRRSLLCCHSHQFCLHTVAGGAATGQVKPCWASIS